MGLGSGLGDFKGRLQGPNFKELCLEEIYFVLLKMKIEIRWPLVKEGLRCGDHCALGQALCHHSQIVSPVSTSPHPLSLHQSLLLHYSIAAATSSDCMCEINVSCSRVTTWRRTWRRWRPRRTWSATPSTSGRCSSPGSTRLSDTQVLIQIIE